MCVGQMEHFECWRSRLQHNMCLRQMEHINVSAPGCNTIHVSGRWSTLSVGTLSCNTKRVKTGRTPGYNIQCSCSAGIQMWDKEHLQVGHHSVLNFCDSLFNTFDISVSIRRLSDPSSTSSHTKLQSQGTHTLFHTDGRTICEKRNYKEASSK